MTLSHVHIYGIVSDRSVAIYLSFPGKVYWSFLRGWNCNSLLCCRGVNKAFLCIIWLLELFLKKLITVIVLWEFLYCFCLNYPSMLCDTSDVLLIQRYQWESTLLTVGIIMSFCFMWKVPWFHGNSRFTVWCLFQVCTSIILFSVACEYETLDEEVMVEGITWGLGQRLQIVSDWTVVKQSFANTAPNNVWKTMDCLEKNLEAMLLNEKKMDIKLKRHRLYFCATDLFIATGC